MADETVRMRVWASGAYALSCVGPNGRGALVEHDGRNALHVVGVTAEGFEETVVRRRASARGVVVVSSRLRGDLSGDLLWERTVDRAGLRRTETWSAPADARGSWRREDTRPGRRTRFERDRAGTMVGTTWSADGSELWRSRWEGSANRDGWRGVYASADGVALGEVETSRSDGSRAAAWSGPVSSGSLLAADGGGSTGARVHSKMVGPHGETVDVTRTDDGEGHSHEVGTSSPGRDASSVYPGRSWFKITVPHDDRNPIGPKDGGTGSVEWGTEVNPDGTSTNYTSNVDNKPDGSSSFSRTDQSSNGDTSSTFGGRDADGNGSYSATTQHPDGSWTTTTRTVDKNGDGTEHVTTGDKDGNVTSDGTSEVKGGVTQPSPSGGGSSGGEGGGGSGGQAGGGSSGGEGGGGSGGQAGGGSSGGDGGGDPNDPHQPDQPDHPDPGGGSETGQPGEDGGVDPNAPREGNPQPPGIAGGLEGDHLGRVFGGAYRGDEPLDDVGAASERVRALLETLGGTVVGGGSGGWDGEEMDGLGRPIVDTRLDHPPSTGGSSGGDDPRILLAWSADLVASVGAMASSANLIALA